MHFHIRETVLGKLSLNETTITFSVFIFIPLSFLPGCSLFPSGALHFTPALSQSIFNASLLFKLSEVSDWCECRPCSIFNAHTRKHTCIHTHAQTHIHSSCYITDFSVFFFLGRANVCTCARVCVYTRSQNSREVESIPSPSDFLLHCTQS